MNKRPSVVMENLVDLMGFDSPDVVSNHDSRSVQNVSDDPFEFHLRKALENKENSSKKNVPKSKMRFSYLSESMMNELDTSYDLINGTYNLNDTVLDATFNSPLRRKSMSMGNLTTYGVPISFETIKAEANKVVTILKDPNFILNEHSRVERLSDVTPRLNNSTSSEDEIGLPKVLKLSIGPNTTFDLKECEEIKERYRKLSTSLQNINQTEILNTTIENCVDISNISETSSVDKKNTTTNEKPLKIDSKIKLLQKGINLPNSLKTVKRPAEISGLKKGPIKAFAPVNQRINTSKTITRPSTCPIRKISNVSVTSMMAPVASSTPEKRNLSNSRISRPKTVSTTRVVPSKSTSPKPSTSKNPHNTLGNDRKIQTIGGLKKK